MSWCNPDRVMVRFFGTHRRAFVAVSDCLIFSKKDPNANDSRSRMGIGKAIEERDTYIANLRAMFGFEYGTFRQPLDPSDRQSQLKFMLPRLNNSKESSKSGEKENLTPKNIKGSASICQVEQKSTEKRTPTIHKDTFVVSAVVNDDHNYYRSRSVDKDMFKDVNVALAGENSVHVDKNDVKEKNEVQFDPRLVIKNEPLGEDKTSKHSAPNFMIRIPQVVDLQATSTSSTIMPDDLTTQKQ